MAGRQEARSTTARRPAPSGDHDHPPHRRHSADHPRQQHQVGIPDDRDRCSEMGFGHSAAHQPGGSGSRRLTWTPCRPSHWRSRWRTRRRPRPDPAGPHNGSGSSGRRKFGRCRCARGIGFSNAIGRPKKGASKGSRPSPQRAEVRKSGRPEARGWRVGRSLTVHGSQDWTRVSGLTLMLVMTFRHSAQHHRRLQGSCGPQR